MIHDDKDAVGKVVPWKGRAEGRAALLQELTAMVNPRQLLPTSRLEDLFRQVLQHQIDACDFHFPVPSIPSPSLLRDHHCRQYAASQECQARVSFEPLAVRNLHHWHPEHVQFQGDGQIIGLFVSKVSELETGAEKKAMLTLSSKVQSGNESFQLTRSARACRSWGKTLGVSTSTVAPSPPRSWLLPRLEACYRVCKAWMRA